MSSKPQDDDSLTLLWDTTDNYVKYFNKNN